MKRNSILGRFLFAVMPIYLALLVIGGLVTTQLFSRDSVQRTTDRISALATKVTTALDIHEADKYPALARDLIAPLSADSTVICAEFRHKNSQQTIASHPHTGGCNAGQQAPYEMLLPVDDYYDYELYVKFTGDIFVTSTSRDLSLVATTLALAFAFALIANAVGFRIIVNTRLLALYRAMTSTSNKHQALEGDGRDELGAIIRAYKQLLEKDGVRERQVTAANEIITVQANQDPLTGLYNRRVFKEVTEGSTEQDAGALMLVDIDHLSRINDEFGHTIGDEVLVEVANRLKGCLPDDAPIVRWDGEQMLVYLKNLDYNEVNSFASMLLSSVGSAPVKTAVGLIPVTISIGVVRLPFTCGTDRLQHQEAATFTHLALHKAKVSGRNCAVAIAEQSLPTIDARKAMENDFEQALNTGVIHIETLNGPHTAAGTTARKAA